MEFKVKSLLDKFFEGTSSLQEEQELKEFFLKGEHSKDFKAYLPLFQYFNVEKTVEISNSEFRQTVIDSIISELVEKYFEGISSLGDEQILKSYFSGYQVSENLQTYQPIFDFAENETGLSLGLNFDSKLKVELIKSLLDKYFNGDTTIEEEKDLKQYLNSSEVDDELEIYSNIFSYFELEKKTNLSSAFDLKLSKKLSGKERKSKTRRLLPQIARAAAAVGLIAVSFWFISSNAGNKEVFAQNKTIDWSQYEPKDPEEAYKQTMAALAMVSTKMKEGKEQTLKGFSKIKTANDAAGL